MKHSDKTSGFSLVELSVVLVIMGLLLAAITGGSHLIHTAKLNQNISEINGYVTALNKFKDKYKAWPGDMPDAVSFWGTYNASTNPNGTVNGDGNELIQNTNIESPRAWQQLALSGLIAGRYTGVEASGPNSYLAGVNAPSVSTRKGAFYLLVHMGAFDVLGNAMQLGANMNAGYPWGGALTASDAHLIDIKIDDGLPHKGILYTIRSDDFNSAGNCIDQGYAVSSSTTVNYILTNPTEGVCRMLYWLNKL